MCYACSVTTFSGVVAISIDPFDPSVSCVVGRAPERQVNCSGVWTTGNASVSAKSIRIRAADPCASARDPSTCNATAVWRPGPYYVTALCLWSSTTYLLVAAQPGSVTRLSSGETQSASMSLAFPAVFLFSMPSDDTQPAVRFTLTADEMPVRYYIASCVAGACSDGDAAPGPGNPRSLMSGVVEAYESSTATIAVGSPAFCSAPSTGCSYYIAIYPPTACDPVSCSASFSIVASSTAGGAPLVVPWNAVQGAVAVNAAGVSPATGEAAVELYLSPFGVGPVDVLMTVGASLNSPCSCVMIIVTCAAFDSIITCICTLAPGP